MLISGGLRRSFRARPAYYMVGLMFWLVLTVPFSFWKGGSIQLLVPAFETEFSMFFLLAGLLLTLREVKWFLSALAVAGALVILRVSIMGVKISAVSAFPSELCRTPTITLPTCCCLFHSCCW